MFHSLAKYRVWSNSENVNKNCIPSASSILIWTGDLLASSAFFLSINNYFCDCISLNFNWFSDILEWKRNFDDMVRWVRVTKSHARRFLKWKLIKRQRQCMDMVKKSVKWIRTTSATTFKWLFAFALWNCFNKLIFINENFFHFQHSWDFRSSHLITGKIAFCYFSTTTLLFFKRLASESSGWKLKFSFLFLGGMSNFYKEDNSWENWNFNDLNIVEFSGILSL